MDRKFLLKNLLIHLTVLKKLQDYNTPLGEFERENNLSILTEKIANDEEIAGTHEVTQELNLRTVEDLTMVYCISDASFSADALSILQKKLTETYGLDPF